MPRFGDAVVEIPDFRMNEKKERKVNIVTNNPQLSSTQWCGGASSPQYSGKRAQPLLEGENNLGDLNDDDIEEDTLGWFGRVYAYILNLNVVFRYAIYIIPIGLLLAIPIIVLNSIEQRVPVGPVRLIGLFIWLELVWLTLWGSNFAAGAIPPVFRLFSGFLSRDTQKYSDFLRALETPITLLIWSACAYGSVALLYRFPYDPDAESLPALAAIPWNAKGSIWTETMKRVFLATIPVAAVYLVEKIIVQWVAVNYHETQFASKLKEANRWVSLITALYQTSTLLFPIYCKEFQADDDIIHNTLPPGEHSHYPSHFTERVSRAGADLKSRSFGGLSIFASHQRRAVNPDSSVVIAALAEQKTTDALARRIWQSLAQAGSQDLYEEDIIRALDASRRQEAEAFFLKLDFNRNGAVSLEEMTGMLSDVARARKAITRSMSDVKSSIQTFSAILVVAGAVAMAIIYAAFFSSSFLNRLQVITTAVLSLSFAFAGTVQEFAAAFIFLFVKHPYDVGDRCEINNEQVEMIVEKISLLHTIFRRVLDNRLVQIPNSVNSVAAITNISRSHNLKQRIHIMVNINTTGDQIEFMQAELTSFVQSAASRRDYTPDINVMISAIDAYESVDIVIVYGHKSNWSNESLRLARRNRFMAEILATMRRLDIKPPGGTAAGSGSLEYPQYSVDVTKEEVQAARDRVKSEVLANTHSYEPVRSEPNSARRDWQPAPSGTSTTVERPNRVSNESSRLSRRGTRDADIRGLRKENMS